MKINCFYHDENAYCVEYEIWKNEGKYSYSKSTILDRPVFVESRSFSSLDDCANTIVIQLRSSSMGNATQGLASVMQNRFGNYWYKSKTNPSCYYGLIDIIKKAIFDNYDLFIKGLVEKKHHSRFGQSICESWINQNYHGYEMHVTDLRPYIEAEVERFKDAEEYDENDLKKFVEWAKNHSIRCEHCGNEVILPELHVELEYNNALKIPFKLEVSQQAVCPYPKCGKAFSLNIADIFHDYLTITM